MKKLLTTTLLVLATLGSLSCTIPPKANALTGDLANYNPFPSEPTFPKNPDPLPHFSQVSQQELVAYRVYCRTEDHGSYVIRCCVDDYGNWACRTYY